MKKLQKQKKQDLDQMTIFDCGVEDKMGHGGKRENAGRKKGKEKTIVMRVPESLVDEIRALIEAHKAK